MLFSIKYFSSQLIVKFLLWVTRKMVHLPLRLKISSIILSSVFSSNELVASSNIKISGELYRALAIEIHCI